MGLITSVTTQPTKLHQRLQLARTVRSNLLADEVEGLCDSMDNTFQQAMAAWPIRAFVLAPPANGKVVLRWKAQPDLSTGVYGYDLEEMTTWVESNMLQTQT